MSAEADYVRGRDDNPVTVAAAVASGEVWQLKDGRAAVLVGLNAAASGDRRNFTSTGKFTCPKTASVVFLDGGRAFWDVSAGKVHFKKTSDRDFYLGRFVGDATSAATTCVVDINVDPPYDLDLSRDPALSVIVGTAAAGGFGYPIPKGGANTLQTTSTSEAQKVDLMTVDGFAPNTANAIVEMAFRVVNDGAGSAADLSLGVANGTHATDGDAITGHLFVHLDANSANINLQSKDGTTTVTATDTTVDYVEGSALANRVEVWFDMRDPTDVQVYVDGVLVLGSTVFAANTAGPWFLLAHLEKTSAADVYEAAVDWLRARFSEQ